MHALRITLKDLRLLTRDRRALIVLLAPGSRPEFAPAQEGELRNSIADITHAQDGLGYRPARRLADELPGLVEILRTSSL